jgi:hypothetical protein
MDEHVDGRKRKDWSYNFPRLSLDFVGPRVEPPQWTSCFFTPERAGVPREAYRKLFKKIKR